MRGLAWFMLLFQGLAAYSPAQGVPGNVLQPYVQEERIDGVPYLFVVNPLFAPITIQFEVAAQNLEVSPGYQFSQVFPPRSRTLAFIGRPIRPEWSYNYRWNYVLGDINAVTQDVAYALPFAPDQTFRISQGYAGGFSHRDELEFSLDFAMPEGTPIHAAREGVVIAVQSIYSAGGPDPALRAKANYITILHPDGSFAHYAHLRFNGSVVTVGQQVERGQLIGYSGNTGFSSGPHLHFHVYRVTGVLGTWVSLPTRFSTAQGEVLLAEGSSYTNSSLLVNLPPRPAPPASSTAAGAPGSQQRP
ncbi:MAG: M23 family metallopeptidase [Meiothermus sp.]|nr:M23 family metallopeptidase [Meiothermus sp.]